MFVWRGGKGVETIYICIETKSKSSGHCMYTLTHTHTIHEFCLNRCLDNISQQVRNVCLGRPMYPWLGTANRLHWPLWPYLSSWLWDITTIVPCDWEEDFLHNTDNTWHDLWSASTLKFLFEKSNNLSQGNSFVWYKISWLSISISWLRDPTISGQSSYSIAIQLLFGSPFV